MSREKTLTSSIKEASPVELAPQPGSSNNKEADAGDALLMLILTLGKFFSNVFKLCITSYCFWVMILYVTGATMLIIGFRNLSPSINGDPACPAKQNGYLLGVLWYIMAFANLLTAYGYHTVESTEVNQFEHLTFYTQVIGFLIKTVPPYTRMLHVVNLCQLNVMTIQILFLPECNSKGLLIIFAIVFLIWWMVVGFGRWCKRFIFVPPHLYSPLRPGRTFFQEIEKMMSAFGP